MATDLRAVMVYLPPDVAERYQQIADWEGISLSAVCRRILVVEDRERQAKDVAKKAAESAPPRRRRSR